MGAKAQRSASVAAEDLEPLLTAAEVATFLRCSKRHVQELAATRRLAAARFTSGSGRKSMLRFRRSDVVAYFEAHFSGAPVGR